MPHAIDRTPQNFARFVRSQGDCVSVIQGFRVSADDDRVLHVDSLGEGRDWRVVEVERHHCEPPKIRKGDVRGALPLAKWYARSKPHWLTREQAGSLFRGKPEGFAVKVLALDRNFADVATDRDVNPRGVGVEPERFFRKNWAVVRVRSSGSGGAPQAMPKLEIAFDGDEEEGHEFDEFEFDVEFARGKWYPLQDGVLPAEDPQGMFQLLGRPVRWEEFRGRTRVGCRGPMMLWDALRGMPSLYHAE